MDAVIDLASIVALAFVGVFLLLRPVDVMRIVLRWPKYVSPRLLRPDQVTPLAREALDLIDRNPREYARRFWYQLIVLRITGGMALLIALVAAVLQVVRALA